MSVSHVADIPSSNHVEVSVSHVADIPSSNHVEVSVSQVADIPPREHHGQARDNEWREDPCSRTTFQVGIFAY